MAIDLDKTIDPLREERSLHSTSGQESRLHSIERELEDRKIPKGERIDEAMKGVKKEFGYHLKPEDYGKIKKSLKRGI